MDGFVPSRLLVANREKLNGRMGINSVPVNIDTISIQSVYQFRN